MSRLATGRAALGRPARRLAAGAKRQHLAAPMDHDGTWLDVGCANGYLMATLPIWCAERGVRVHVTDVLAPTRVSQSHRPCSRRRWS